MSIRTLAHKRQSPYLAIHCKRLTREARLYLDDKLVLLISPPPEVEVVITGDLELDGDPATFDGAFQGTDKIELQGELPDDFDPAKIYQPISTSGATPLQIGDRIGEFKVVDFTEVYDDYRITGLDITCYGLGDEEIKVYEDSSRKHLFDSYQPDPGGYVSIDAGYFADDRLYLEIGKKYDAIDLTGRKAARTGDSFLDCTVMDIARIPLGPPHYMDLTLGYVGTAGPISLTAYDGQKKDVIAVYEVYPAVNPIFTLDGSGQPKGYLGDNLVLEYGPIE
jgi:hypothetical protein